MQFAFDCCVFSNFELLATMPKKKKFTKKGFPVPDPKAEYEDEEVVWALIRKDMPYWPAQVKIGGTCSV